MSGLYQIYGQVLKTDFVFKTPLLQGIGSPDVTFTLLGSEPEYDSWKDITPISFGNAVSLYLCTEYDVLHFANVADFYIFPNRIVCHLLDATYDYQVEVLLLGLIFAYWLEKQGIVALHAAAVNIDGRGVAFLSTNKGGKSSLAASFVQMGYSLITDDILPVARVDKDHLVYSSFPQMRMWPELAQHFIGHYKDLPLAHPSYDKRRVAVSHLGDFCVEPMPLRYIFLPQRSEESDITLEQINPVQGLMSLIANSFAANFVELGDLQKKRLRFLSSLSTQTTFFRLTYPSGLHHLPDICKHILDEI